VRQLKRDYKVRNIFQIRKVFRPHLNEEEGPKEEVTSLEEGQKEAGIVPITSKDVM